MMLIDNLNSYEILARFYFSAFFCTEHICKNLISNDFLFLLVENFHSFGKKIPVREIGETAWEIPRLCHGCLLFMLAAKCSFLLRDFQLFYSKSNFPFFK
jgi:hypothetical protein